MVEWWHSVWAGRVQILGRTLVFSVQNCCQSILTGCPAFSNSVLENGPYASSFFPDSYHHLPLWKLKAKDIEVKVGSRKFKLEFVTDDILKFTQNLRQYQEELSVKYFFDEQLGNVRKKLVTGTFKKIFPRWCFLEYLSNEDFILLYLK